MPTVRHNHGGLGYAILLIAIILTTNTNVGRSSKRNKDKATSHGFRDLVRASPCDEGVGRPVLGRAPDALGAGTKASPPHWACCFRRVRCGGLARLVRCNRGGPFAVPRCC